MIKAYLKKISLLNILLILLSGCEEPQKEYHWIKVGSQSHVSHTQLSGHLKPTSYEPINSPVEGSVTKAIVQYGHKVDKNQPIFYIDSKSSLNNLRDHVTSLKKNKRQLEKLIIDKHHAQSLYTAGGLSREDMDSLRDKISDLKDENAALQIKAQQSAHFFNLTLDEIMKSERIFKTELPVIISAPIAGTLLESPAEDGKVEVGKMIKENSPLAVIADTTSFYMVSAVTERNMSQLKKGMHATITGPAITGPVQGIVSDVKEYPFNKPSEHEAAKYNVKIKINSSSSHPLKIGMSAFADVQLNKITGLSVPISAICRIGTTNYVRLKSAVKKLHKIQISDYFPNDVIVSNGLNKGGIIADKPECQ